MVTFSFHWRLVLMPPPTPSLRGRECRFVVMPKPQAEQEDGCLHFLDKCSPYEAFPRQIPTQQYYLCTPGIKTKEAESTPVPVSPVLLARHPRIFLCCPPAYRRHYILGVDRKWYTAVSETVTSSWVDFLYVASSTWILTLTSFHVSDLFQRYTHHNSK